MPDDHVRVSAESRRASGRPVVGPLLAATLLLLAWPATSDAQDERIRVVERITVDAEGHDLPLITSSFRVRAPASNRYVKDLLTQPRTSDAYAEALRELLAGMGTFPIGWWQPSDPFAPHLPRPRPRIKDGQAHFVLRTGRRITGDEDEAHYGHWRVTSDGSRIELMLRPERPGLRTILTVRVRLRGALLRSTTPPPSQAGGGDPLTWRLDSKTGLRPIALTAEAQGEAARYLAVNRADWGLLYPLSYALSGGVVFIVLLWLTGSRAVLKAFALLVFTIGLAVVGAQLWDDNHAAGGALLLAPSLAIAHQAYGARNLGRRARRKPERLTSLAHAGVMLAFLSAATASLLRIRAQPFVVLEPGWSVVADCLQVAIPAVTLAFVLTRVVPRCSSPRRTRAAVAGVLVMTGAGLVLSLYWWGANVNVGEEVATALGMLLVAGSASLGTAAVVSLMAKLWPPQRGAGVRRSLGLAAAALIVVSLLGSWIRFRWIGYERYVAQHELLTGTPLPERFSYWVQYDAYAYAAVLGTWLLDLAPFFALAGALGYLHANRRSASPMVSEPELAVPLLVLLFATFVGTTGGELYFYRIPIAFTVAFVALWLILSRRHLTASRISERFHEVDRDLVLKSSGLGKGRSMTGPPALVQHLRSGFLPRDEEQASGSRVADARAHALEPGPHPDWWANAVASVRLGALVAVLPAVHYLYAAWAQRRGEWGLGVSPFGLLDASLWLLYEYAFWLVASFTLGALYLRLPGRTGVVKGFVLGSVFALAQAAAEALPGRYDVVSLPFVAAEAIVVLALVGLFVDLRTVRLRNLGWQDLLALYDAGEWQLRLRYVGVALPVLFVLAQQVISGAAEQTITELVNAAQTLPQPGGPPAR